MAKQIIIWIKDDEEQSLEDIADKVCEVLDQNNVDYVDVYLEGS